MRREGKEGNEKELGRETWRNLPHRNWRDKEGEKITWEMKENISVEDKTRGFKSDLAIPKK